MLVVWTLEILEFGTDNCSVTQETGYKGERTVGEVSTDVIIKRHGKFSCPGSHAHTHTFKLDYFTVIVIITFCIDFDIKIME